MEDHSGLEAQFEDEDEDVESHGRSLDEARAAAAIEAVAKLNSAGELVKRHQLAFSSACQQRLLPLWVEMIEAQNLEDHAFRLGVEDLTPLPPGLAAWPSKVPICVLFCLHCLLCVLMTGRSTL